MKPVLQVKNLTTVFVIGGKPYKVVEDLSFNLYPGKTLSLLGETGCGKTLTALSLLRLLPKPPALNSTGEVLYQNQNLLQISEKQMRTIRGKKIAMIFQDPSAALNPVYTIGDQLMESCELHLGLYGDEAIDRVIQALNEVGIPSPEERLNNYPHQLSGGMKQRVMIALALICDPDVLIADEPTTALDVTIQAQVLELIRALQKRKKTALLLITHDMGVVAEMADEVIVMYASQAAENGTVYEIFDETSHPYTMGLFHARHPPQEFQAKFKPIRGSVPSLGKYPQGCRFHPRCPYVMNKCKNREVPKFPIGKTGHWATCWLHDGTEESRTRREEVEREI